MAERVFPHDLQAEVSFLGAILVDPDLLKIVPDLKPEHFFRAAHRALYAACVRVDAAGHALDVVALRDDLARAGTLEDVGGLIYISTLTTGVPRAMNVEGYARIIREKATLRDLITYANTVVEAAYTGGDEVDELVNQAEAGLAAVSRGTAKGDFVLASDWMAELWPIVDRAVTEKRAITGVPSGFGSIDRLTRGFQPGDLILIAARPSIGKTALSLQIAAEASRHVFTAFVSLEMSRLSIGWRALALESRTDAFRLMTGDLSPREMPGVAAALERIGERQLAIDDASGQSVSAVCAKVRRLAARYGLGALFVDYIQLMHSGARAENRTIEIAEITRRLKALARDLNIPLVALSQLTRENERENRRPRLSDLREGGSLEQDSDVVLLLHRPGGSGKYEHGEMVEVILAKQRNGPAHVVLEMHWDGPTMRFTDKVEEIGQPTQERFA